MSDDHLEGCVRTRVARAIAGEHLFFGYRVGDELAGRAGFWSLLSLASGHRLLRDDESGLLDDLKAAHMVADPRIQPLKLARMVASRGGAISGYCAGLLMIERSMIGPACAEHAAHMLTQVARALGDAAPTEEAVAAAFDRTPYATASYLPGFGVPFRDRDERLPSIHRCMRARGRDELPHARLERALAGVVGRRRGLPSNIAGAAAAIMLDMGFTPSQCGLVGVGLAVAYFLANAVEGAAQQSPVMQSLPATALRYVGAPPRETRRARAAREAAGRAP